MLKTASPLEGQKEDPQAPGLQFAVPAVLPMNQKEVGTDALIFW